MSDIKILDYGVMLWQVIGLVGVVAFIYFIVKYLRSNKRKN